jgi:hypothetical protein
MRSALEDALATQLLALPVDVVFDVQDEPSSAIEQRMDAMKQSAIEHRAVAVFWLDVRTADRWFLYAVDAQVEHMVLRPLVAKPDSREATIESVAVIVRATTDALLHGETLPAAVVPPLAAAVVPPPAAQKAKPTTPWPVVNADRNTSALRLAAGYVGTTFAKQLKWQSGLGVRADWVWSAGPFLGLGYTFFEVAEFNRPEPIRFTLARHPIALRSGLRFASGDFTFTGELDAEIELREGTSTNNLNVVGDSMFTASNRPPRVVYSVCPKLESEFSITSWLRVYAGAGADIVLSSVDYKVDKITNPPDMADKPKDPPQPILEPSPVRLTVQAGIAVIR